MARRGLLVLLALTIVVVGAALALSLRDRPPPVEANAGQPVLPGLADKVGDVAQLAVKRGAAAFTLVRGASGWGVAEKGNYPADAQKVRQALLGLADLKYVEAKTRKSDSYPRLELEDPGQEKGKSALVEVKAQGGQKLGELIVGKRRYDRLGTGQDGVYVRRPGDAQAWLAQGTIDLANDAKDWLDKKVVSIPASRIRQVTITQPDGAKVVLSREKAEDKFVVADGPADAKWKADSTLAEPAGALADLELSDVAPAASAPVPEDAVAAELVTFDGLTLTTKAWEKDGTHWLALAAAGTGEAEKEAGELGARLKDWVYAIPAWKARPLKYKLDDLTEPAKAS